MLSPENRRRFLDLLRASRAAEEAELIAAPTLLALRGHQGVNQTILAKRLSQFSGSRVTQNDISRLERGGINRTLQLAASRYFRSLGYEADETGASLYIPPYQRCAAPPAAKGREVWVRTDPANDPHSNPLI